MPRRNLYVLLTVLVVSFVCYKRADSAARNRYASMTEAFVTAMSEIRDHFLYDADEQKLFEGAMDGLAQGLGDKYSRYSGADDAKEFRESLEGEFGGIGISVGWNSESKVLRVLSPIIDTPAYKQGLMAGDEIIAINGESTEKISPDDAVRRLRGRVGEAVKLTIRRPGEEPRELEIVRAVINVDSVLGDRRGPDGRWDFTLEKDPSVGLIRINQFGEKTTAELRSALQQCRSNSIRGLILDLRGNGGGLLTAANETCDFFIKDGVIVTTKDRDGHVRQEFNATGEAQYTDWPMAVLVDGESASASEIVAACLQDHGRAVIVGERTVGKGTVQATIDLGPRRGLLLLTIAGYWRPSNRNIHKRDNALDSDEWGVMPSPGYEVILTEKQLAAIEQRRRERDVIRRPGDHPIVPKPLASATPTATSGGSVSATATVPGASTQASVPAPTPTSTSSVPGEKPQPTTPTADSVNKTPPEDAAPATTTEEPPADGTDLQLEKALEYIHEQIGVGKPIAA